MWYVFIYTSVLSPGVVRVHVYLCVVTWCSMCSCTPLCCRQEQYVFIHDVVAELVRRKTEVDRYDEPAYSNQVAYSNLGYGE